MTAGGASGPLTTDAGLLFPQSRFVAVATFQLPSLFTDPTFATVREPLDAGVSVLEAWTALLMPAGERRLAWSTDFRVEQIASNLVGTTAIAGHGPSNFRAYAVLPASGFFTAALRDRYTLLPVASGTRLVRLRVLAGTSEVTDPIITMFDGPAPYQVQVQRVSMSPGPPITLSAPMTGLSVGDDLAEYPADTLGVTGRCESLCTFGGVGVNPGVVGPVLRHARAGFSTLNPTLGPAFGVEAIVEAGPVAVFSPLRPTRVASTATTFFLAGQGSGDTVRLERRQLSGGTRDAVWTSTGVLQVVDVLPTVADTVLVLGWVQSGNDQFNGTTIPYSAGSQRNVVLIKLGASSAPTITTWNVPGDQEPVAMSHTLIGPDNRVIIVGNQGNDAFLWRVAHP